ncbi:MAG: formate dehydrogenase accessory sulfurtransferase FdhD [Eubacteriales bacterium]
MEKINQFNNKGMITKCSVGKRNTSLKVLEDVVVCEHSISLYIEKSPKTIKNLQQVFAEKPSGFTHVELNCSPENLEELIIGHLLAEQYIYHIDQIQALYIDETGASALVSICALTDEKKKYWEKAVPKVHVPYENIKKQAIKTLNYSELFKQTGALHIASLWKDGVELYNYSDIGRHNAIDKVIGRAMQDHVDFSGVVLFTSGRVPCDIVQKIVSARIPILASRSAPTDRSIELARKNGIVLLGFVRGEYMNNYTLDSKE